MKKTISILLMSLYFVSHAQNLQWVKTFSGGNLTSINVDTQNNVYSTGYFYGSKDFNPSSAIANLTSMGNDDIFISKLNSVGNFVWAKRVGGYGLDRAFAITNDNSGNVYVTGYFQDTADFDPGPGNFTMMAKGYLGGGDMFILKLDSLGNFVWAKQVSGGSYSNSKGYSILCDPNGDICISGIYNQGDFDPGPGVYQLTGSGGFVLKLDQSGNFIFAKSIRSNFYEFGGFATDALGNLIVSGYFSTWADFDPGLGVFNLTATGSYDGFVCKLSPSGNFLWAKKFGGKFADYSVSSAVDMAGNVYTIGSFKDTADLDPGIGVMNFVSHGMDDIYVSKMDTAGNLIWAKQIGGQGVDIGKEICIDQFGNVIGAVIGFSTDFDPGPGTYNLTSTTGRSSILKLDASGNFSWAFDVGGGGNTYPQLDRDLIGNIYFGGRLVGSCDFEPGPVSYVVSNIGADFVSKFYNGTASYNCGAHFTVFPDTVPHNWFALNQAYGTGTMSFLWNWDDGSSISAPFPSHTYSNPGYYNICLSINDSIGCKSTYCDSSTYIQRNSSNNTIIQITVLNALSTGIANISNNSDALELFPNPVRDLSLLSFTLSRTQKVNLLLFNNSGRLIQTIVDSQFQEGKNTITLNVEMLSSGIYFLKLEGEDFSETRKVSVIK